jgi:NAD(P) transhydrogenase subunit beta
VKSKYAVLSQGGCPGVNIPLTEADVPYDQLKETDDINGEFSRTAVTLVIAADGGPHPAARTDTASPIYGMPILRRRRVHFNDCAQAVDEIWICWDR